MEKKKRGRKPIVGKDFVHYRIRFKASELEKVEQAAARRGFGTQEFMRLACSLAAQKVLDQPPEKVLGLGSFTSSTPANAE